MLNQMISGAAICALAVAVCALSLFPANALAEEDRWVQLPGPDGGIVNTLAMDPADTQTLYAGTANGVFKTTNGGASWTAPSDWKPYTSVSDLAVAPSPHQTLYVSTHGSGVYKSTDSGANWTVCGNGLPRQWDYCLAVDPSNSQIVYAGLGWGEGLMKSVNGGADWTPCNNGLPGDGGIPYGVNLIIIDPQNTANPVCFSQQRNL